MNRRFWSIGIVWCCLVLLALPAWAQFGGGAIGGGGGLGGGSVDGDMEYGPPVSVELTGGTLGELVEKLRSLNVKSDEYPEPVSILLSDKLSDLKIGDVKLADVPTSAALRAVAQLNNQSFQIEPVAAGRILVVRPTSNQVEVRAIRLSWMDEPAQAPDVSAMMSFVGGAPNPESDEQRKERLAGQLKEREARILVKTDELLKTIDQVFRVHAEISGDHLPLPRIMTQQSLGMMMVVGSPESVTIAAEVIEATNSGASRGRISGIPATMFGGGRRSGGVPGTPGGMPQPGGGLSPDFDPGPNPNKP